MRGVAAHLALAVAAAPLPGLACSPVPFVPAPGPAAGERCSEVWYLSEIRAVGLSPATDLGGALIAQDIFDGNACYWEANLLVHDCARGAALVIGADDRALMTEPRETGIDRIAGALEQAAARGARMTLEELAAAAAAEGYGTVLTVPRGRAIEVNGQRLAIDCACARLYPGVGPAQ